MGEQGKCKSDKRIYTLITLVYGTEDKKMRLKSIARGHMNDSLPIVLLIFFYLNGRVFNVK